MIIFALGLLLNVFPSFNLWNLRVAGVLQRIAVVYFVVSLIVMHTSMRTQVWISGGVLCFYWALLTLIPVPGVGAGVLTPEGNLAAFVDSYLVPGRMWHGTWDPEGLLSTVPAVVTTLLGVLTGQWLRSGKEKCEIAGWMFVAGWGAILVGIFWGILFPINKNLWTSSFVMFTAGAALQFLAVCYWLIDIKGYKRWCYPAVVYGMNALAVYALSGMVGDLLYVIPVPAEGGTTSLRVWILDHAFASWAGPMNASLAFAVIYVIIWFFLMDILYRKRIFIKV